MAEVTHESKCAPTVEVPLLLCLGMEQHEDEWNFLPTQQYKGLRRRNEWEKTKLVSSAGSCIFSAE
jgi:hypothetical protein